MIDDDIEPLMQRVEHALKQNKKQEAFSIVAHTLKKAIRDNNIVLEQKLLWMTVAWLQYNNLNYDHASDEHPEITKLSELYNLIEYLGRIRHPHVMRLFGKHRPLPE